MTRLFAVRRMVRNGVLYGSICSSLGEIAASSAFSPSYPAAIPLSYSFSYSSMPKPSWLTPISNFQSPQQQPSNRSFCSSSSSSGQSKTVVIESEDQFNSLLRKVQDESLPAIFYFTAVWCGPCRFITPVIGELSEKYPNVTTYKIDIDNERLRSSLDKLNISAVPTLHFFQSGKKVSEIIGADVQRLKSTMENLYK